MRTHANPCTDATSFINAVTTDVKLLLTLFAISQIAPTANAQPAKQQEAKRLDRLVHAAIADGDYAKAVARGLELAELLPDSHLPPYNLACAYSLLGDKENSVKWLKRAAENGFLLRSTAKRDGDLDAIRTHPGYAEALAMIQQNNAAKLEELKPMIDSAPLITHLPPGYDGTKPVPLIIALHSFGGRARSIADIWKPIAAEIGAIVVAPQAHTRHAPGFTWGIMEHAEYTVRKAIERTQEKYNIDGDKIVLTGFSQGADMSFYVALNRPTGIAGVIPVSGFYDSILNPIPRKLPDSFPRFFIMNGARDKQAQNNRAAASALQAAGASVELRIYDGIGHAFPKKNDIELREAIRFVLR